jgi:serine/threonine protein kinase
VDVPRIYSSFEVDGNYYLATEYIEGVCLHNLLDRLKRRIPVPGALEYGIQLARIFSQIHAAGWVWRECKPMNIIVTPEGELRPLDFEGACPVDQPDPLLWGTPGFIPPERRDPSIHRDIHDDLYALGSMLYLLLTGRVAEETDPLPIEKRRRNVPAPVRQLVMRLLSRSLDERPPAERVARELKAALSIYGYRNPAHPRLAHRQHTLQGRNGRGLERPPRVRSRAAVTTTTTTALAVTEG